MDDQGFHESVESNMHKFADGRLCRTCKIAQRVEIWAALWAATAEEAPIEPAQKRTQCI